METYQWSQAQADILAVSSQFSQAQALLNREYQTSQAQADIKAIGRGFAQANALLNRAYQTSQSQADIKKTSRGFAQALADIKKITSVVSQAQALLNRAFGFSQSQADIKKVTNRPAQAQAFILKSNAYAQALAYIYQVIIVEQTRQQFFDALTPMAVAFSNPATEGNLMVVLTWAQGSGTTITAPGGAGWTQVGPVDNNVGGVTNNSGTISAWYKLASAGQTNLGTWGRSGAINVTIASMEVSGASSSPWTTNTQNRVASSSHPVMSAINADTGFPAIVIALISNASSGGTTYTPDSPFTEDADAGAANTGFGPCATVIHETVISAAASYTPGATHGASNPWAGIALVFIPPTQGLGQAQAYIIGHPVNPAQAQAFILKSNSYSQAQADIKKVTRAFSQSQAQITRAISKFAQAQTYILGATSQYAQAQGYIAQPFVWAQAQADILVTTSRVAQAQANLLVPCHTTPVTFPSSDGSYRLVWNGYVTSAYSAHITVVETPGATGDNMSLRAISPGISIDTDTIGICPKCSIDYIDDSRQIFYAAATNGGAANEITFGPVPGNTPSVAIHYLYLYVGMPSGNPTTFTIESVSVYQNGILVNETCLGTNVGQAQAYILNSIKQPAQAQATIRSGSSRVAQAQADILVIDNNKFAQAAAWIGHPDWKFAQARAQIKYVLNKSAQANALINAPFRYAQARALIRNGDLVHSQAQAKIKLPTQRFAQAQTQIAKVYNQPAQALALLNQHWGFAQALSDIFAITTQWAQAQAFILKSNAYAQAQVQMRGTATRRHAQAQVKIRQTYRAYAQAKALILTTRRAYAQAQADINATSWAFAQALTQIKISYGTGQSQAKIVVNILAFAQAQCEIAGLQHAQAQAYIGVHQEYIVKFEQHMLPGYLQSESFDNVMRIMDHPAPFNDGSVDEYAGLQNKVISLRLKVIGETYLSMKDQVNQAGTILRSTKNSFSRLYLQRLDRYFIVRPTTIKVDSNSPESRFLEYQVDFDARPWAFTDVVNTVSGVGSIDTGTRLFTEGTWTPARVLVTGTNVTVSGYTEYGHYTGYFSVSGGVTNLEIDSEAYTATVGGINKNHIMRNLDYAIYVGPGKTYFTVTGATSIRISWNNRW